MTVMTVMTVIFENYFCGTKRVACTRSKRPVESSSSLERWISD